MGMLHLWKPSLCVKIFLQSEDQRFNFRNKKKNITENLYFISSFNHFIVTVDGTDIRSEFSNLSRRVFSAQAPHTPYRVDGCSVKGAVRSLHLDKVSKVSPLLHLVPVSMCCHHSLASKSSCRISMALVSMEMAGSPGDGSVMLKSKSPRCAASTSVRAAVHACSGVDRLSF